MSSRWRSLAEVKKWREIRLPGVYVIFINGFPAYVGQSKNLAARIKTQARRFISNPSVALPGTRRPADIAETFRVRVVTDEGERLSLERRLIRRLEPPYNSQHIRKK